MLVCTKQPPIHQPHKTAPKRQTYPQRSRPDGASGHRPQGESAKTVRKWVSRYRQNGLAGLEDLSSRPKYSPARTAPDLVAQVESLRRERLCYEGIANRLGLSKATICRLLRARGPHRLHLLEPPPPVLRYERAAPGELIHFDIKKLGRIERIGHLTDVPLSPDLTWTGTTS